MEWKSDHEKAFLLGFQGGSIYSNPFPDESDEARVWVDGWVAGFQEYGPR